MPTLSFGVWQVPDGAECVDTVRWALELGYRHIDTAQAYGNEESVGRALRESSLPREDVFITTKFYPGGTDPAAEAEHSLRRLGPRSCRPVPSPLAPRWARLGPGPAWNGREGARLHAVRSGSRTSRVSDLRALSASSAVSPPPSTSCS